MDTVSSNTKSIAQQGQEAADQTANAAQGAIRSTQRAADTALDSLSAKVEDVRNQAAPLLNKVTTQAEAAARRGMEAVRDTSQQLRERALRASDSAVGYVKDEPIKAMLIAAATGALLMGLISLMRPLARLGPVAPTMIHPLLRLLATEPHLIGDHVEAYAELVGDEVKKTSTAWGLRIGLYLAALCLFGVGLVLTGVALMLWGALPTLGDTAPWLLFVVPAVTFAATIGCILFARSRTIESGFDNVKTQLNADMAMLREVSAA